MHKQNLSLYWVKLKVSEEERTGTYRGVGTYLCQDVPGRKNVLVPERTGEEERTCAGTYREEERTCAGTYRNVKTNSM